MRKGTLLFLSLVLVSSGSFAAKSVGDLSTSIDIRPSMSASGSDSFFTENSLEVGVKVSEAVSISYLQGFNTNISNTGDGGLGLVADSGFFRGRIAPLYTSADETVTFSYQPRLYTPTKKSLRQSGYITTNRNYFILSKKVNDTVSLTGIVLPIFHIYSRAGNVTATGAKANPWFENRVYAIADFNLGGGFSFGLPLYFHQQKQRSFAGASNSGDWNFVLWTWPEVLYEVQNDVEGLTTTVGLAYYSGNLVASDLSKFQIEDGLADGVVQATFQAKF